MSKKYTLNKKKFFSAMFTFISVLFLLYFAVCYFDIAFNNLSGGSNSEWNLLLNIIKSW